MTTEILGLDEILASQSQKEVAHNTALRQIEGRLVRALSKSVAVPPPAPVEGASYIVAANPTGAWSGQAGKIAHFFGGAWKFWQPTEGIRLWVNDEDKVYAFDGSAWVVSGGDPTAAAASAIAAHEAASDPHPQYLTQAEAGALYDAANAASSAISAHLAASDPHPTYLTQAEGDARYASTASATGGTVTSVGLTTPGVLFDVSGSPVTSAGTLAMSLKTQAANKVLAGPASGADAAPTMRALVAADIPSLTAAKISDFSEAVDDRVGALLVAGTNITLTYDDTGNALTIASTAAGGGGSADAQTFTANGTWTKPTGAKFVQVVCVGGGGGGGGGAGFATSNNRLGGSGGGGGAFVSRTFNAADLPATVSISVGAGGAAGSGGTGGAGTSGGTGGTSSFGTFLSAYGGAGGGSTPGGLSVSGGPGGGSGGPGGVVAATQGGLPATANAAAGVSGQGAGSTATNGLAAEYGGASGAGSQAGGGYAGGISQFGGGGGGGGGSISSSNFVGTPAAGGNVLVATTAGYGGGGAAGVSAGPGGAGANGDSTKCGQGGGGGAANASGTGGVGGAGGYPAGGGGGGGSGTSTGGAGGVGGRGEVRIYAF